ncbi:hypothetical protein NHH03_18125 [Stieleria sp. TO1_6]|uniref:hypothetical protein n=1 Tax=Stieleria tagensis TaxID=2956795 RepID=UPI00209B5483|nr:hypothetical protein [Stieleria tagensis]MCO8123669.1 hypothetical protein [Stieleria tagensis]
MKRIALAVAALAAIAFGGAPQASADYPSAYPFVPFGFYQPYGASYGTSLSKPPYFALNPPVYYGARFARPYGMSPFASPPMAGSPDGYKGRLRSDFYRPPTPETICNPCISQSVSSAPMKSGLVRSNPFVAESQLADSTL